MALLGVMEPRIHSDTLRPHGTKGNLVTVGPCVRKSTLEHWRASWNQKESETLWGLLVLSLF